LTESEPDRLDLKVLPLTLCLYMVMLGIIVNWVANLIFPMSLGRYWGFLGLLMLWIAFRGVKWCFRVFAAANTNTNTTKPALAIVEHGPYKFSRNPMYVCYAIGYAIIIQPEEAYLERTFGERYLEYKQKVRRWI